MFGVFLTVFSPPRRGNQHALELELIRQMSTMSMKNKQQKRDKPISLGKTFCFELKRCVN
jgi:hypothetical protein